MEKVVVSQFAVNWGWCLSEQNDPTPYNKMEEAGKYLVDTKSQRAIASFRY